MTPTVQEGKDVRKSKRALHIMIGTKRIDNLPRLLAAFPGQMLPLLGYLMA